MSTARPLFDPDLPPEHKPSPASAQSPRPRKLWPRVLAWIGGILAVLLILIGIMIAVILNSARVHSYILAKAQSIASEQLGAQVQLQNFALNLSHLTLDVYGVTIHGANPHPEVPLLQLQHAEVGIGIVSLLHKNWYISSLRVDHPIVQILIDKSGNSNLPKPKTSKKKSNTSIFDLGVRHAILDRGEVYFNAQKSALSADLHDLEFRASFTQPLKMYSGTLAYRNGDVLFGSYRPFQHNFDAQFDLTPSTFQLHHATLTSAAAKINLAATATNLDAPIVDGNYQIDVDGAQIAQLIHNPTIPAGTIRATGKAHYQQIANRPALNSLQLSGDITSRQLLLKTRSISAAIDNLAAHYSLANGDATLHDFRANVLGGEIIAQGTMKQFTGDSHSQMTATIRNVSLAQATQLAGANSARSVSLTGVLNANAKAAWGKAMKDVVAQADASIHGSAASKHPPTGIPAGATSTSPASNSSVALDSEIHATYNGTREEATLTQSYVHLPQTNLTLNGTISKRSSLAVRLQANDLAELARIANMFSTPKPGQAQQPLNLTGQAMFNGSVQGSTTAPHITGQLSASNLHVNGTSWKVFRTNVDASPSEASLRNADLEPASNGRITLSASTGLKKWTFINTSPIQLDMTASQLNIADLLKLTGKELPISGTLNAQVHAHGTELNPVGNGTLSITKLVAYNEPINTVQVSFDGTGDEAHANLSAQMPAGSVQSDVSIRPKEKTYTAQLTSSGIDLSRLATLKARNMNASGIVALQASGHGSFENPQLNAAVQIPTLEIQKQTIKNVDLKVDMANHVANALLTSSAMNSNIQANARVNLTGDYETDASVDTQGIPLQPVVAMYSPADAASLSGETELHATVHGPLKNQKALEAHVTIPYLRVGYSNNIQLASAAPIKADYQNGVLQIQHGAIRGTDTDLQFQGSIPVIDRTAPMSLLLQGTINLQLAQVLNPDIRSSGQLRFRIDSRGTTGRDIGGEIDIVDANYASGDLPVGLQHGNGVLTLTTDRVNIKSFQGTVGTGTVTASGGVAYRPAIQFDLGLAAKGVKMLYPQGMREAIDANIRLAGTTENSTLGGTVNIADISFTPAFDLTSFAGQFSSGVAAPPSQGIAQNINLNLAVHSTNNVSLISRTLSVNGSANLQVRGTAADPVILGRVNLTGGDVVMNNDRFVLTGGTIQFVNPSQTQPVINLNVTTTIQQYNLGLRINGPSDHMNIQYTSDPALPQADILNLLAFGTTSGAAAGQVASDQPTAPPTQMAESLVASQVTSQISSRIAKVAGISQLSISPVLGNQSNNGNAGANITIQQRVTGNLFITFSTNTATTQSQTIQGQYKVSPRFSLSATRDPNGGFAVDTLIKKTW